MKQTIADVRSAVGCLGLVASCYRLHRYRLWLLAVLSSVASVPALLSPWLMRMLIDRAYPDRNFRLLGWLCGALLAMELLSSLLSAVSGYISTYVRSLLEYRLSFRVFSAIEHLPHYYREQHHPGMFLTRAGRDVQGVAQSVTQVVPQAATIIFTFLAVIPLMMRLNVGLTLVVLAAVPANYFITVLLTSKVVKLSEAALRMTERLTTFMFESIEGATISRLFSLGRTRRRRFRELLRARLHLVLKIWRASTFWGQLAKLTSTTWSTILLCGGWYLVFTGRLELGQAVALGMYMNVLVRPFEQIGQLYQTLLGDSVAARRLLEVLNAGRPATGAAARHVLTSPPYHYELRKLSFSYGPDRPCLHDLCLTLRAGQTVAVVGPTGGGKSTLLRILSGLDDRYQGQFLVDGRECRGIDRSSYMHHISLVPQTSFFFSGSLRDNLPNDESISDDYLRRCASLLGLDTVIDSTPEGLDARLHEKGIRLSAGQYQKLAVLRAVLKKASVLLLDEVTASMDIESERTLLRGIVDLRPRDCLTVLVTHHIPVTSEPWIDEIVVLVDGRIVERGSCAALCERRGFYQRWLELSTERPAESGDLAGQRLGETG